MDRRIWVVNALLGVGILVVTGIFDLTLTLGKFHGLVFALYSAYAAAGLLLVNIVLALWRRNVQFFYAGIVVAIAIFAIVWSAGALLG